MKICALELPARFGDPEGQLVAVDAGIAEVSAHEPVDLVLLPECALTGYVSADFEFDLRRFAEPLEGPTLAAYREIARAHGVHLAGPLIEVADRACFNSFVVVDPAGQLCGHYRKRHPWFPERWATRGTLPYPDLHIAGLRLSLAICFDLHFLAGEARDTLAAADVLLFPSAWVDEGDTDLRADLFAGLVRRFGLTIVNANWGEGDPLLPGQGRSRIVGPSGVIEAPRRAVARAIADIGPKPRAPAGS